MANRMNRRAFLGSVALGAGALASGRGSGAGAASEARPNILFCMSDDQSWLHASAYGSKFVDTPAFDRVAREGALFTNTFVSCPTCCPSRATVLTGQDFYRLGEGASNWGTLDTSYGVYPDRLEAAGYHVGYTGKGWAPGDWGYAGWPRNPAGPLYRTERLASRPTDMVVNPCDYTANFRKFLTDRKPGQPFGFWYGCFEPHRPYVNGSGLRAGKRLEDVDVPPFLPDIPEIRSELLDYALEVELFDSHLVLGHVS